LIEVVDVDDDDDDDVFETNADDDEDDDDDDDDIEQKKCNDDDDIDRIRILKKRRTKSLGALPKDGPKSLKKVRMIERSCDKYVPIDSRSSYSSTDERIYDLLETTSTTRA